MAGKCSVLVGNIGTVFEGDMGEAIKVYEDYVEISKMPHGRAAGEEVILFCGSNIEREYYPEEDDGEEEW